MSILQKQKAILFNLVQAKGVFVGTREPLESVRQVGSASGWRAADVTCAVCDRLFVFIFIY